MQTGNKRQTQKTKIGIREQAARMESVTNVQRRMTTKQFSEKSERKGTKNGLALD